MWSAPLSSMFSILSLFTEDVKLRHDSVHQKSTESEADLRRSANASPKITAQPDSPRSQFANTSRTSFGSAQRQRKLASVVQDLPHIPLLNPASDSQPRFASVHPGIVARATIDTTIAVIPAEVISNHKSLMQ